MSGEPVSEVIHDRFQLGPLIGRGAMGEVYRGRDLRLGRDIAIKLLRPDVAPDLQAQERFADEARSAAGLSHPSIVTVYDGGEWRGAPYLVMECLPGRSLADELPSAPLDPAFVRRIGSDVAAALALAHQRGVIHRDVKPSNVLLTEDGRAKLADFGIAKSSETVDRTQTGLLVGTPSYLAPERLEGRSASAESDVYALGVVLYEALTAARPFSGDSPLALAHAVHTTTPPPVRELNPRVDPRLAAAVEAAIARDPNRRPTAADLVSRLAGRPADGSPTETTEPAPTAVIACAPTEAVGASSAPTTVIPSGPTEPALGPPAPTAVAPAAPIASARRPPWLRRRRSKARGASVVALAVALALGFVLVRVVADDGRAPSPPATTGPESPLPPPLGDALTLLEEAVEP